MRLLLGLTTLDKKLNALIQYKLNANIIAGNERLPITMLNYFQHISLSGLPEKSSASILEDNGGVEDQNDATSTKITFPAPNRNGLQ